MELRLWVACNFVDLGPRPSPDVPCPTAAVLVRALSALGVFACLPAPFVSAAGTVSLLLDGVLDWLVGPLVRLWLHFISRHLVCVFTSLRSLVAMAALPSCPRLIAVRVLLVPSSSSVAMAVYGGCG